MHGLEVQSVCAPSPLADRATHSASRRMELYAMFTILMIWFRSFEDKTTVRPPNAYVYPILHLFKATALSTVYSKTTLHLISNYPTACQARSET